MPLDKHFTIPQWLDTIIFDQFEAIYEPRPMDVVYNPDQPYEFVKIYLGTYFPRSYAEAYGIVSQLLSNNSYLEHFQEIEEINILDFCCGTGGEVIGTINALQSNLPHLKRINVDAFDANPNAVRFLYHLINAVNLLENISVQININPQCIFIESEQEIQDIVNMSNLQYHFMMSFKAINEFIQHNTFCDANAYELIAANFFPLMSSDGVFIMADVATKLANSTQFYPQVLNKGLNDYLKKTSSYKSIIPTACYNHESSCQGCYMQDVFYISHRKANNDKSKIAYRVLCKSDFADELLKNVPLKPCRATNPLADKNLPYK